MNTTGLGAETYKVSAACHNCGYSGNITTTKGIRIIGSYECPNCGCNTLKPTWSLEK